VYVFSSTYKPPPKQDERYMLRIERPEMLCFCSGREDDRTMRDIPGKMVLRTTFREYPLFSFVRFLSLGF